MRAKESIDQKNKILGIGAVLFQTQVPFRHERRYLKGLHLDVFSTVESYPVASNMFLARCHLFT